jgi:hypothetical protein
VLAEHHGYPAAFVTTALMTFAAASALAVSPALRDTGPGIA